MMKNNKIIKYLLIAIAALILLPANAKALNEVAIYHDIATDTDMIYTNIPFAAGDTCHYALESTDAVSPAVIQVCLEDSDGNFYIPVPSIPDRATAIANAQYLWVNKNGSPAGVLVAYPLEAFDYLDGNGDPQIKDYYADAIESTDAEDTKTVSKRIETIDHGDNKLEIVKDDPKNIDFESYKYIAIKVEGNITYEGFWGTSLGITALNANNPIGAILAMSRFVKEYNDLFALHVASDWKTVIADTDGKLIIETPEDDTEDGDRYIVWIKGIKADASEVIDLKLMTCSVTPSERDYEYTREVYRMPNTGISRTFDYLLIGNAILLPLVYLRKRSLKKAENAK